MDINDKKTLRLRFYKDVPDTIDEVLNKFLLHKKKADKQCFMKIRDYHIFLDVLPEVRRFWSPQLHVELVPNHIRHNETHIRCLFGPDQTLWTFFMFLHFIVAGVFVLFAGLACSNYILKLPVASNFLIMGLMIMIWFLLYSIAKQIRENGKDQMDELEEELDRIINS